MVQKKIAILGGGLAGLSAALYFVENGYSNDFEIHIFEKNNNLGGLVAGQIINGNIYEYGPHFFHTNNPDILKIIKKVAEDILIDFNRTILIKFMGNYFKFPLSILEVFKKLPKDIVFKAILSLIKHNLIRIFFRPKITDSEVLLLGYYGQILYKLFFKDYIYHVWGIYPKDFSYKFAEQRIPKISTTFFLNKVISPIRARFSKSTFKNFVENVDGQLFTTKEGYRGIVKRIINVLEKNGVIFHLNSDVKSVNLKDDNKKNLIRSIVIEEKQITETRQDYTAKNNLNEFDCDAVISTIPINELLLMLNPKPAEDLISSADKLKFRALVFVGVLVNKSKVLPVSFMYFREHSFNRIYDSSYFGHDTYSPNTTILVAEISSSGDDIWWNDEEFCKEKVLEDLFRENIIKKDDILEVHVYKYKHGYPIYNKGYEDNLGKVLSYLKSIENFQTAGRQGLFQYINGHIAMLTAFKSAEKITKYFGY